MRKKDYIVLKPRILRRNKLDDTPIMYRNVNGVMSKLFPKQTHWYLQYIMSPNLVDYNFYKKFRLRFRLPYDSFLELCVMVSINDLFLTWHPNRIRCNSTNHVPLKILLLASLRYMGRRWTFDDLEKATGINRETRRRFSSVH